MSILARLLELITPVWSYSSTEHASSQNGAPAAQRESDTSSASEASDGEFDVSKDPDHERDLLLMMHICC